MGRFPCLLPCSTNQESDQSHSHSNTLGPESSIFSSISSQPSLPSVSSLNPSPSRQLDHQTSAASHHCLATLRGSSSYVCSLAVTGNFLYSGFSNSEIRVWSRDPFAYNKDSIVNTDMVANSNGAVKSSVIVKNKLFTAHQDCKIRVWRTDNVHHKYDCIATLPTINDRFLRFFHPKTMYRTFKVWRTSDFRCIESVANAHDDAINALVLSNDGYVYTGSADKKIKVWKKQKGDKKHSLVATLERHKSAVNALGLSSDGSVMYSGACNRSILVWEKNGGGDMVVFGALRGHTKPILCLAVVSDLVCSGSADNTVRIWRRSGTEKMMSYSCLFVFEGHRKPVKCLTVTEAFDSSHNNDASQSGTSYLVYSGSLDCDIRIWQFLVPANLFFNS